MDPETKKAARRLLFSEKRPNLGQLFLDARGFAGQVAQVVQLGFAYVTATLDAQAVDQRRVGLEGTLDTNTAGDLAHGEGAVQAAVTLGDHDAFEGLQTLTVAFLHFHLHDNGVARCERRDFFVHLLGFEHLDNLVGHAALLRQASRPAIDTLTIVPLADVFLQQLLLFSRKRAAIQKISAAFPGPTKGLLPTPAPDVFM